MINNSLNNAAKNDVSYRRGLPIGYQNLGGLFASDNQLPRSVERQAFENQIKNFITNLKNHIDLDRAIDLFSLENYLKNSLPPSISNGRFTY